MSQNTMQFFRLFPDVIYKKGHTRGTLNILVEKRLLLMDEIPNTMFSLLENNCTISEVSNLLGLPLDEIEKLLKRYELDGLGCFLNSPSFIDRLQIPNIIDKINREYSPLNLPALRLVLLNDCNQGCIQCHSGLFQKKLLPCVGCWKKSLKSKTGLSLSQIQKALNEASLLNCETLLIQQGNPSMVNDLSIKTIYEAKKNNILSINYTTGSSFSPELLKTIMDCNVIPTFQISINDENSRNFLVNHYANILVNIEALHNANKEFDIVFLSNRDRHISQSLITNFKKNGARNIHYNWLDTNDSIKKEFDESLLAPPNIGSYLYRVSNNKCDHSVLTLDSDGCYYDCPIIDEIKLGNVDQVTIQEILSFEDTDTLWENRINEYSICSTCEFYFACNICKVSHSHFNQNHPKCGYEA